MYFQFIGKFIPPQDEYIPTDEELAEAEKLREKRDKQREANKKWYAKKRGEFEPPVPLTAEGTGSRRAGAFTSEAILQKPVRNLRYKRKYLSQSRGAFCRCRRCRT
ncbi:hypothetical protein FACS1894105_07770 [Clostridia bacterium]|nr:hypothetical protein FACS1894105_07660 [Clostridia bacterium]GHU36794.1 hypothetical protein FACS1894105_07770 [Clostridia bacterium]